MELKKEVTVKLTPADVREMIIEALKAKGVQIESVDFHVGAHNMEGDWMSQMPLIHTLDEIRCKGVEI